MSTSDRWLAGETQRHCNPESSQPEQEDFDLDCRECFSAYVASESSAQNKFRFCSRVCEERHEALCMRSHVP